MTIRQVLEVEVLVSVAGGGAVTLLFTPLQGGVAQKDSDGNTLRFGVPLSRDAAGLAGLVHDLARWITGLAVQEIQDLQAQVERATAQTRAAAPQSPG